MLLASVSTACAPPPAPAPEAVGIGPAEFPSAHYRQAQAAGRPVLDVDPERSLVIIAVGRAGALARVGHDHVIASRNLQGRVLPDEGRSDLYVPLDRLVVDEPGLRTQAGLDTQPSAQAVAATRRNMLEKVLETQRHPYAFIRVARRSSEAAELAVTITLHGTTRTLDVPAQIETVPEGVRVSGRMSINQSDFGIVPYSVFGGALQVRDRVDLRFAVLARRPA